MDYLPAYPLIVSSQKPPMVELFTTVIVTVCSAVLFGYWLRCAFVLLCGQYLPCP